MYNMTEVHQAMICVLPAQVSVTQRCLDGAISLVCCLLMDLRTTWRLPVTFFTSTDPYIRQAGPSSTGCRVLLNFRRALASLSIFDADLSLRSVRLLRTAHQSACPPSIEQPD